MRILIQGPMESESDVLFSAIENPIKKTVKNFDFVCGKLSGDVVRELGIGLSKLSSDASVAMNAEFIMSRTHIGLVYAALATQIAIEEFHPDVVIIQGTSGAHNPELKRGDIIIGDSYVNIDSYVTARRAEGEGQDKPDYKFQVFEILKDGKWQDIDNNDSLNHDDTKNSEIDLSYNDNLNPAPIFKVDPQLVEIAKKASDDKAEKNVALGKIDEGNNIYTGRIGSGDSWNRMADKILEVREKLGTDVEEMETFAVAKTCEIYGIPCLPIRVVSNSEFTGEEFDESTAKKCQCFAIEVALEIAKEYNPKN